MASNYHPLTILSYAVNYKFSKLNPFDYIQMNMILHVLNTLLVFMFVFMLTKQKLEIAILVSLFFGIHPMHVESVTWISERKDVLYAFFFLGGLIFYLRYLREQRLLFFILAALWFVVSLLSKSAAVVFPVVLLLIDYVERREINMKMFAEKAPLFILSVIFGILAIQTQSEKAIGDFADFGFAKRLTFPCYGFMMYIMKLIAPVNLSAFYPYPAIDMALPTTYMIAPLFVIATVGITWYSLRYTRLVVFGLGFFFVNIALVLQFVSVGNAIMADRYTYVAYIGLFLLMGWGLMYVKERFSSSIYWGAVAGLILYAGFFAYASFERTKVWKDSGTLWSDVISKHNNIALAYNNLGLHYKKIGDVNRAVEEYSKAITLQPDYYRAYGNRSNIYKDLKQYDKAIADCNKVLEIDPNSYLTYTNRGAIYAELGQLDQALKDYNQALAIDPTHANAYFNRGQVHKANSRFQDAKNDFTQYLYYFPGNPGAYEARGQVALNLNQYQEAIQDFSIAIQINPSQGMFYARRSDAYNRAGNTQQALNDALTAQKLGTTIDPAYLNGLKQKLGQ